MKYLIFVFMGACSYGVLSTFVKLAYGDGYQLGEVVGSQMLAGTLLTWGLVLLLRWNGTSRHSAAVSGQDVKPQSGLSWKQRLLLMAAGTPTTATGLLYYGALQSIPASLAIILLFQFTWITVIIDAVGQRKRPNRVMLLTLLVLFAGTVLAAGLAEQGEVRFTAAGIVLGLLSAVSYTLFIIFSGKAVPQAHPFRRSAWMMTGGFLLVCLLFPPAFLINGAIWGMLGLYGLWLGLFGAFIPPLFFTYGIPHIGSGLAAVLGAAELPVAVLCSALVLHEQVYGLQWLGVALILLGVSLPELVRRLRPPSMLAG